MSFSNKPDAGHAMSGPITKQSADAWIRRNSDTRSVEPGADPMTTRGTTQSVEDILGSYEYEKLPSEALDRIERLERSEKELVEALERAQVQMREFVDFHHKHDGGCSVEFEDATEYVEEALKKARGGK